MLTDFGHYPAWNAFVVSVAGAATPRARLAVCVQPSEGRIWRFRPRIVRFSEERELCWRGRLGGVPWLLDRHHCFHLQPDGPGRTRFVQRGEFRGLLSPLLWGSVLEATERGLEDMNAGLKERAEREHRPRPEPDAAVS